MRRTIAATTPITAAHHECNALADAFVSETFGSATSFAPNAFDLLCHSVASMRASREIATPRRVRRSARSGFGFRRLPALPRLFP